MCMFLIKAYLILQSLLFRQSPKATTNAYISSDTSPLELIFRDLSDLAPITSSCGYTFFFFLLVLPIIIFTWVYPLKINSHTLSKFTQFKSLVDLEFNLRIKFVQTNDGDELCSFIGFLISQDITHRIIYPIYITKMVHREKTHTLLSNTLCLNIGVCWKAYDTKCVANTIKKTTMSSNTSFWIG